MPTLAVGEAKEGNGILRYVVTCALILIALVVPTGIRASHSQPFWRAQLAPFMDGCLVQLVDRENPGWDPQRYNTSGSGAYGLPQALPGSKMRSEGSDWRTNPVTQLRWMAGYVRERWGGACGALQHSNAYGWY